VLVLGMVVYCFGRNANPVVPSPYVPQTFRLSQHTPIFGTWTVPTGQICKV
jgi:hypothetical protein